MARPETLRSSSWPVTSSLVAALTLLVLSGCSMAPRNGGTFSGEWTAPGGERSDVEFVWQMRGQDTGQLTTELGDRHFVGYFARIRESGAPVITSVYNAWDKPHYALHDWPPEFQGFEPIDYATFVRAYAGRVLATLTEPGGVSVRCNFEPTLPARSALSRLRGLCQVSDGGRIHLD